MKHITYYALIFLLLPLMFLGSCKKDIFKGRNRLNDTTKNADTTKKDSTRNRDSTVRTIAYGYYNYIAADTAGNIYALHQHYGADTIYKIDKAGNTHYFYTPPAVRDADTLVVNTLTCLATDSGGNVYTINNTINHDVYISDVVKITPAGSGNKIYSNVTSGQNVLPVYQLSVDGNGLVYFSDRQGIKRIATNGSTSLLVSSVFNYAMDRMGDVFYVINNGALPSIAERYSGGLTNTIFASDTAINKLQLNNIISMATDRSGNLYISETYNNNTRAAIFKLTHAAHNYNQVWSNKIILQTMLGHIDGKLNAAQIFVPFSMTTDGAGNLYFSEKTGSPNDIRKITF